MRQILFCFLLLAACASTPPKSAPMPDGARYPDFGQWVDYCHRNPSDPKCPR